MSKFLKWFCNFELFRGSRRKALIEKLLEEILINVFEYLDPESVKEAALVCQKYEQQTFREVCEQFLIFFSHIFQLESTYQQHAISDGKVQSQNKCRQSAS